MAPWYLWKLGPVRELSLQGDGHWVDGIVPVAMEVMAREVHGLDFSI
jgi:hypothetical protein